MTSPAPTPHASQVTCLSRLGFALEEWSPGEETDRVSWVGQGFRVCFPPALADEKALMLGLLMQAKKAGEDKLRNEMRSCLGLK